MTSYTRHLEPVVREALGDSPVVFIQGPRQCGKTTLAQRVGSSMGYSYVSFDEVDTRRAALNDPAGFVHQLTSPTILDEIQRVPELLPDIKHLVDRRAHAGQFLLTGSMRALQMSHSTDSLAGRVELLRLHPLSQAEVMNKPPTFIQTLFSQNTDALLTEKINSHYKDTRAINLDSAQRIVSGGYVPAMRRAESRRLSWYNSYITNLIQDDLSSLIKLRATHILPKLLRFAAEQTAQLLNVDNMASMFRLSRNTIDDYLYAMENLFLLQRLPAWHIKTSTRWVKRSKLHICDSGLLCAMLRLNANALIEAGAVKGPVFESFVLQELQRQASAKAYDYSFYHYRDKDQFEVDVVIEHQAQHIAGIEVKAGATVGADDFRGLKKLKRLTGSKFQAGVILYQGTNGFRFGDNMYALPLHYLWQ